MMRLSLTRSVRELLLALRGEGIPSYEVAERLNSERGVRVSPRTVCRVWQQERQRLAVEQVAALIRPESLAIIAPGQLGQVAEALRCLDFKPGARARQKTIVRRSLSKFFAAGDTDSLDVLRRELFIYLLEADIYRRTVGRSEAK